MHYRFGDFRLDVGKFRLARTNGDPIDIQPRSLELLLLLVQNAGELVARDTIIREVWSGLNVSPNVLPVQVQKIRAALGDTEKPHTFIETVPRKGLRFIGEVSAKGESTAKVAYEPEPEPELGAQEVSVVLPDSALIGDQPTIAVLRFDELDKEQNLSGLARALPADIITALSRLQLLKVTAGASSFVLDQSSASPLIVKSALGVDYCVSGHVSRLGNNYLIYAELSDTSSQQVVWSGQFEAEPRDVHQARSDMVGQIVGHIENQVPKHEAKRLRLKQPESLTAWQAFHVGSSLTHRRGEANMFGARTYFQRAVAIDPGFARAWSGLAHTYAFEAIHSSLENRQSAQRRLFKSAERALEADPDDPSANLFMGRAISLGQMDGDPRSWFETAVNLAPSYAMAHQQLGSGHLYRGEIERAIDHAKASIRLNPNGPLRFSNFAALAIANTANGDMPTAIEWGMKAGGVPFDDLMIMVVGLCAFQVGGKPDQAARLARRMKTAFPGLTRQGCLHSGSPCQRQFYADCECGVGRARNSGSKLSKNPR